MEDFKLLISPEELGGVLRPEQVELSFETRYNRKAHPEDRIEESWEAALAKNPRLFNGSKFRLHRVSFDKDTKLLRLELGLTSYKEYLGTNRLEEEHRQRFQRNGLEHFEDEAVHFSNALGCEAALVTCDQQLVLLRRSGAVGTHAGLYNGPSGHPEPKNVGFPTASDWDGTSSELLRTAVMKEIFQSAVDEVVAETGVPPETLSEPQLMGFMADPAMKPDVLFLLRTSLDSIALKDGIGKAQEAWESDRLVHRFCFRGESRRSQTPPLFPVHTQPSCETPCCAACRAAVQMAAMAPKVFRKSLLSALLIATGLSALGRAGQLFSMPASGAIRSPNSPIPRNAMNTLDRVTTEISPDDENRLRVNAALPASNVVALRSPQDLAEVLERVSKTGQLLVVDYYAPWCRACQKLLRYMQKVAKEPTFRAVEFASVDFDRSEELVQSRNVDRLPTMEIYKGQELKQRWSGANTKKFRERLESEIDVVDSN
eukprot:s435_g8.t1